MADENATPTTTAEPTPVQALTASYDFDGEHAQADEPAAATPAPSAPVAIPAPVKPKHSPRLMEMAADLGMNRDFVVNLEPDQLEDAVHQAQRYALAEARAEKKAKEAAAEPKPAKAEGPDWGTDEQGNPYTEKDYLPGVAATIKRNYALEKEVNELKGHVQAQAQRETQRQAQTQAEMFDAAFESLGASYEKYFGKGSGADMENGSPAMKRRISVLLLAGAAQATSLRSLKAKLKEAADTLYEPEPAKAEPYAEVTAAAPKPAAADKAKEAWKNGGVARPTHRRGAAEPAGRDKATKAVGKLMEEFGGAQDTTVTDEFPE